MKAILLLALIAVVSSQLAYDTSSYANIHEVQTKHVHLNISLNFDKQIIEGTNTLTLQSKINNLTKIILDTRYLNIYEVLADNVTKLNFEIERNGVYDTNLGQKLTISLNKALDMDQTVELRINYSTSKNATALNWLTKEQTQTKVAPYLFSQCESINCRSIAPLQDSPSIKATYSAVVYVNQPNIQVFMSAFSVKNTSNVFYFNQPIPVQSYLIAIIAGNVERRQIGERTGVITEPTDLDRCANELSDLELFLNTVENYTIPYVWGIYNIVILPPSFPFGGMENPMLTFASPTIIVGDKSEVNVAIHEIAHSWTGNLVTMQNWGSFWLNEGFTVFLERKGLQKIYGKDFKKVAAYEGNASLTQAIEGFGVDNAWTQLCYIIGSANPDDSFSTIPYEKGFQFLNYLESIVGESLMQQFLRAYLTKFQYQSIVTEQFIKFYYEFFLPHFGEKLLEIDLNQWIYRPGYPPALNDFTTVSVQQSIQLALDYLKLNGTASPSNYKDYFNFFTNLKLIFLETIQKENVKLSEQLINRLNKDYQFDSQNSTSIRSLWFSITLFSGYRGNLQQIDEFAGQVGRMKYVTPIYQNLVGLDKNLAIQIYKKYENFYHPIATQQIKKILGLSNSQVVSIQEVQVATESNKFLAQ